MYQVYFPKLTPNYLLRILPLLIYRLFITTSLIKLSRPTSFVTYCLIQPHSYSYILYSIYMVLLIISVIESYHFIIRSNTCSILTYVLFRYLVRLS